MLIQKLKNMSRKIKVKKVDFTENKLYDYNLIARGEHCDNFFGFIKTTMLLPSELNPIRIFFVNKKFYVYCDNYKLYVYNGSSFEIAVHDTFLSEPFVHEIMSDGVKKTLVFSAYSVYILNGKSSEVQSLTLSEQTGNIKSVILGRIFSSRDRKVYFTQPLDNLAGKTSLDLSILVEVPEYMGSVCGFGTINGIVYVFCKHGILKVENFENENFSCKPLEVTGFDIYEKSVHSIENFIFFNSREKLYKMSFDKIEEINAFDYVDGDFSINLPAKFNEYLLYPIKVLKSGFHLALVYNSITDEYFYTTCKDMISYSGGYTIDRSTKEIYNFVKNNSDAKLQSVWTSKEMDFNSNKSKGLLKFELNVANKCVVAITGDFGQRKFNLVKGNNVIRCNLCSTKFQFNITSSPNALPISNFRLEYIIKGE